ncbi:isochorismatase family cysteine hydrolase [Cohnella faecalis]|uniref:Cysteine hydrolase n=1 Tax=Cohnella faecalis TaxID=2315694 RepID=A0A398CVK9_9BACL|nr:isochorismatase family cysteine hydrolase [Cohnella faecalis]RIE03251.1 cysteine hydrolase [Cohnella faecalis]
MPKYAVLTNDLQYDLVNKNEERQVAVKEFLPGLISFLKELRELEVPIFHLQLIYLEDDPRAERYNGVLPVTRGSEGAKILAEALEDTDIVLEKNKDSGFYGTDLEERLRNLGVDTIIITGMQTQICVQTTAADGFFRGFNVVVPPDGVVSARAEDKQRALDWLGSYCARILTNAEIIEAIKQNADISFEVVPIP